MELPPSTLARVTLGKKVTVSNKYPLTCTIAELLVFSVFLHCPYAVVLSEREKKQPCHKIIWFLALKNWSKEGFNTKIEFWKRDSSPLREQ